MRLAVYAEEFAVRGHDLGGQQVVPADTAGAPETGARWYGRSW
jgi:hypothetical protein